jgi:hypothetical protein
VECDLPSQSLLSVVGKRGVNAGFLDVKRFLKEFAYTNEDQTSMLLQIRNDYAFWEQDSWNATCQWLRAHPDKWTPWVHNVHPPTLQRIQHIVPSQELQTMVVCLSSICIAMAFVCHLAVYVWRRTPRIKGSSVLFCHITLVGSWLAHIGILLVPHVSLPHACEILPFLFALAFTLVFGSLLLKTWRIHRIFNLTQMSVQIIPTKLLLRYLALILVYDLVLLIAWTVSDPFSYTVTLLDPGRTTSDMCNSQHLLAWMLALAIPTAGCKRHENTQSRSHAVNSYHSRTFGGYLQ